MHFRIYDVRLPADPGQWSSKPLPPNICSGAPSLSACHSQLNAPTLPTKREKTQNERSGSCRDTLTAMIQGRVLGARLAPCCWSVARPGVLRCRAAAVPVSAVPRTTPRRAFGSTPRILREKVISREERLTTAVNGAQPEINPAFADIAFAFEYEEQTKHLMMAVG